MRRAWRAVAWIGLVAVLVAVGLALDVGVATGPASAQAAERIRSFDVDLVIEDGGSIVVTERIDYDFGFTRRHGIVRAIPVRYRYDDRYDRDTPLDVRSVSASAGAPSDYQKEKKGQYTLLKIGDPDRKISGRYTYTIVYELQGVLNSFADHDELFWNVTGNAWDVPIGRVALRVRTPAAVADVACFAGPEASRRACSESTGGEAGATFSQSGLGAHDGLTAVVALPKGALSVPPPILDERWRFTAAFELSLLTGALTLGLLTLVVGGLARLVWTQGRDRRYVGSPVDVAFGNVGGQEENVPLLERASDPVEFVPPDDIRPGQLGTLLDEVANPLDVTATVVDLAVRGYLRIEEIPKKGLLGRPDWRLVRLNEADGSLKSYEALLLDSLFEDGAEVELSDLKKQFADRLAKVQDALYDDAVAAGWFPARPDKIRTRWQLLGMLALVPAGGATILLGRYTHFGLLGLPLVIGGLGLLVLAGRLPRRTAKGVGVLRRVHGFRRFIEESEKERARFAERAGIFSEYLPYAIVFGCTEKWARAFSGLDREADALTAGWYISSHPFALTGFANSMDDFAITTSGTIAASAASSGSSGFGGSSGGGFGGGGGGSW